VHKESIISLYHSRTHFDQPTLSFILVIYHYAMEKSDDYPSVSKEDSDTAKVEDLVDRTRLDVLGAEVSYGKNGIPGLIMSPYVFGAAFLASLGGFSFGYDQGVISIINVMPQFHAVYPKTETAFGKSFMTGMLELGAFIGCLFMPAVADRISRKWALTIAVIIFDIGAIMQTAAPNYAVLVAGRTIGGVGVGTLAMVRVAPCLATALKATKILKRTRWAIGCTYLHL
jgi:hypothetical protein